MRHRRGDLWNFVGQATVKDLSGAKVDLTGWAIASEIRSASGDLVGTARCAWIDPVAQTFSHTCESTAGWPIGPVMLDIVITSPIGESVSTDSAKVDIVSRITQS